MPTYEFKCNSCGNRFELFLPMNSSTSQRCPACGKSAIRVLSATAGIIVSSSSSPKLKNTDACDRQSPCCGRDQPCEHRPCED